MAVDRRRRSADELGASATHAPLVRCSLCGRAADDYNEARREERVTEIATSNGGSLFDELRHENSAKIVRTSNGSLISKFHWDYVVKHKQGYVYVIEFSSGVTKVGRTLDVIRRLAQHKTEALKHGHTMVNEWNSSRHVDWIKNERQLISYCARRSGLPSYGGEYFTNVDFDEIIEFAEALSYRELSESATIKHVYEMVTQPLLFGRHKYDNGNTPNSMMSAQIHAKLRELKDPRERVAWLNDQQRLCAMRYNELRAKLIMMLNDMPPLNENDCENVRRTEDD